MTRLLDVVGVFSLGLGVAVLYSLRRSHIRVEYSVSWLAAAVTLLILSRSSHFLDAVADYLGVSGAPFALLIMVLCVFLIVFYRFSVIISTLKDNNIALAQKVAILEYRIQSLNEVQQAKQN